VYVLREESCYNSIPRMIGQTKINLVVYIVIILILHRKNRLRLSCIINLIPPSSLENERQISPANFARTAGRSMQRSRADPLLHSSTIADAPYESAFQGAVYRAIITKHQQLLPPRGDSRKLDDDEAK